MVGTVYLVGAGPGDPGLLTLRGAALLKRADVVVYDALINPSLLALARPDAEQIYGGKRSRQHTVLQGDLNALLVAKAKEGKTVVRLKGGDPYTFGRGGEEAGELEAAGVPFEVVPGVSSIVAAPNYAGIPLTHRDYCSTLTVVTGHEDPNDPDCSVDWAQVARMPGTKVVLMGLRHVRAIARKLIELGVEPSTPAAMIRWGTMSGQRSIVGTLADIAQRAEEAGLGAPAVTIIGGVVELRARLNWFERRPLFRQRIVVTRARDQAAEFCARLRELGAEVLEIPCIRTGPPAARQPVVEALAGLHGYDWLVFTSVNGVDAFFDHFGKAFDDLRDLGPVRIATVGPATAARVRALQLHVDVTPDGARAENIAGALAKEGSLENLRVLLARAEVANPELPRHLEALGAIVDDVAMYRTEPETEDLTGAAQRLTAEGADWVTFTSSSTVRYFHARFDLLKLREKYPALRLASIGPETSRTIRELGLEPSGEADPHTTEGLIAVLLGSGRRG